MKSHPNRSQLSDYCKNYRIANRRTFPIPTPLLDVPSPVLRIKNSTVRQFTTVQQITLNVGIENIQFIRWMEKL
jgi:hypothetical protein